MRTTCQRTRQRPPRPAAITELPDLDSKATSRPRAAQYSYRRLGARLSTGLRVVWRNRYSPTRERLSVCLFIGALGVNFRICRRPCGGFVGSSSPRPARLTWRLWADAWALVHSVCNTRRMVQSSPARLDGLMEPSPSPERGTNRPGWRRRTDPGGCSRGSRPSSSGGRSVPGYGSVRPDRSPRTTTRPARVRRNLDGCAGQDSCFAQRRSRYLALLRHLPLGLCSIQRPAAGYECHTYG